MPRKDKNVTLSVTEKLQSLGYKVADWDDSRSKLTPEIEHVFRHASKSKSGKVGYPDRIYINKKEKLLIIVEEKPNVLDHDKSEVSEGAISGIKWYLSQFQSHNIEKKYLSKVRAYKVLGIAVSGNILKEYHYKFDCYLFNNEDEKINELPQITNFVNENEFLSVFNNIDEEKVIESISNSSKKINNLLRNIDSQKRPILLSALMICLHKTKDIENTFPDIYDALKPSELADNILSKSKEILIAEGVSESKVGILTTELGFLKNDVQLRESNCTILSDILNELSKSVIPLFNSKFATTSNYDIIGQFYAEFLKYAGVSNVKKGIVLTPQHITSLFTELIDLKENDKIMDICCGTGAFLIAGMNALTNRILKSSRHDKIEAINNLKKEQLLGFDSNSTMYICAISNMLFRGDGKSRIYNLDSTGEEAKKIINEFKPTIGFINPPYGGKENDKNPTAKEITFLEILLNSCSRYGIIIAPLSVFFKEENRRDEILKKHTLKAVITMPKEVFQPNANTHTAIAVFETNRSFEEGKDEVVFYDLKDDGFTLTKNKGRTDLYNKWNAIKKDLLNAVKNGKTKPNNIILVKKKIKRKDEWTIFAHSKTDYSMLSNDDFIYTINKYMIFNAKRALGVLGEDLKEAQLFDILSSYLYSGNYLNDIIRIKAKLKKIDTSKWREFNLSDFFEATLAEGDVQEKDVDSGSIPLVSSGESDNGIVKYISEYGDGISKIFPKNCITVDMFCNAFYQDTDFYSVSHGRVNVLLPKFNLTKKIALFIVTLINLEKFRYSYGRGLYKEETKNIKIILPAKKINKIYEPDWTFIEKYIESLPYGVRL